MALHGCAARLRLRMASLRLFIPLPAMAAVRRAENCNRCCSAGRSRRSRLESAVCFSVAKSPFPIHGGVRCWCWCLAKKDLESRRTDAASRGACRPLAHGSTKFHRRAFLGPQLPPLRNGERPALDLDADSLHPPPCRGPNRLRGRSCGLCGKQPAAQRHVRPGQLPSASSPRRRAERTTRHRQRQRRAPRQSPAPMRRSSPPTLRCLARRSTRRTPR